MKLTPDEWLQKGLSAKRESKYVEFKEAFDPTSKGEWCEIIKDLVAMANTGGGVLVVGLTNVGKPVPGDRTPILQVDPADITNKLYKYTTVQFTGVKVRKGRKRGHELACFVIEAAPWPLVFEKPGTYLDEDGSQARAFSQGTVYFRHGAKSEPGTTEDLRGFLERKVAEIRDEWMSNVRKIVRAPMGAEVSVAPADVRQSDSAEATPIRIVQDREAPEYRLSDPDQAYPYRQTELVDRVNELLPKGTSVNSHTIHTIRLTHDVDSHAGFIYKPKYGSPQYSEAFAKWIVEQFGKDSSFFQKAHSEWYKRRYGS